MAAITLLVTAAGLDALVDAQSGATDPIVIAELGLTAANFSMAPTLTALPGEFKRIDTVSGQSVSETIIHMVAQDSSTEVYTVRGIGLFLADGTLFAVYAQADPIVQKVAIASFLIALDIAFLNAIDVAIEFGDASFLYPPATEPVRGVARIATNALADGGMNHETIMTPLQVKRRIDAAAAVINAAWAAADAALSAALNAAFAAFEGTVNAAIAALQGRTITGAGAATGGGDLTANRVITVPIASTAELLSLGVAGKVFTTDQWEALPRTLGAIGYQALPGGLHLAWGTQSVPQPSSGSVFVTLPFAFPSSVQRVFLTAEGNRDEGDEPDEDFWPTGFTSTGFSIQCQGAGTTTNIAWLAIGN